MPVLRFDDLLAAYGNECLVLDFNHLFIGSTLREEVWLLQGHDDPALLERILTQARAYGIQNAAPDRPLTAHSGGEQAILATLTMLTLIQTRNLRDRTLLLHNVLDSLSPDNRTRLLQQCLAAQSSHGLTLRTEATP